MDRMELVEKLREKANVGYEDARIALERTDWDLLEAVVLLEKEGKVEAIEEEKQMEHRMETPKHEQVINNASGLMETVGATVGTLVEKGNRKHLEMVKDGKAALSIPLTVIALMLLFFFWFIVPAAVIAWLVGYRFRLVDKPIKANQENNHASGA